MKIKLVAILFACMSVVACTQKPIIKTQYVEKKVPVNSVPQPPAVKPPVWETTKLTPEDRKDIGKVSKALVVENKQKDGFIGVLMSIINKYKEAADKSELQTKLIVPGINDTSQKSEK